MLFLVAIEITEENLEDLLAYDDLFLDYFNAFLALPVSDSEYFYISYCNGQSLYFHVAI